MQKGRIRYLISKFENNEFSNETNINKNQRNVKNQIKKISISNHIAGSVGILNENDDENQNANFKSELKRSGKLPPSLLRAYQRNDENLKNNENYKYNYSKNESYMESARTLITQSKISLLKSSVSLNTSQQGLDQSLSQFKSVISINDSLENSNITLANIDKISTDENVEKKLENNVRTFTDYSESNDNKFIEDIVIIKNNNENKEDLNNKGRKGNKNKEDLHNEDKINNDNKEDLDNEENFDNQEKINNEDKIVNDNKENLNNEGKINNEEKIDNDSIERLNHEEKIDNENRIFNDNIEIFNNEEKNDNENKEKFSNEDEISIENNEKFSNEDEISIKNKEKFSNEDEISIKNNEKFSNEDEISIKNNEKFSNEDEISIENNEKFTNEDEISIENKEIFSNENEISIENKERFSNEDEISIENNEKFSNEDEISIKNKERFSNEDEISIENKNVEKKENHEEEKNFHMFDMNKIMRNIIRVDIGENINKSKRNNDEIMMKEIVRNNKIESTKKSYIKEEYLDKTNTDIIKRLEDQYNESSVKIEEQKKDDVNVSITFNENKINNNNLEKGKVEFK